MRIFLLALCACLHVIGWGQDFKNEYFKVTNVDKNKANITVADASTLNVLDKVMIIQMTGATYNTDGTVANYNSTGNYEIGTICSKQGNTVYLINDMLRTYDPKNGKVQLVKVQQFKSAIVNSLLEPSPWDSMQGTGGVLAISVEGSLTLNANISADGKGFRGGEFKMSTANCSDFFLATASGDYYNPNITNTLQSGSYKGESIVNLTIDNRGGKGAVANGGGGGNNHNNGGGGGSNLTLGGAGGGNSSTASDACQNSFQGKGGYGLNSNNKERIFLGGGGGAGHGNNTVQLGGGNGGGILFIEAGSIITTGKKISANGLNGSNTEGDGASGGGAGGTIILSVGSSSNVSLEAKGGNGGDEDERTNWDGRCYGEGGGGSGGVIYVKGSQPTGTISVSGGAKGTRLYTLCPLKNQAVAGTNGTISIISSYSQSNTPSNSCPAGAILPVGIIYFKVTHKGSQASAEWKVSRPEDANQYILQRRGENDDWKDIRVVNAEEHTTTYQKADGPLATGIYLYRLKIVEKDRSVSYSPVQQITIKAEDINRLLIHPNPATSEITIVAPAAGEEWLNIYDMKSRLVYRKKVTPNDLVIKQDVSFLSEGVYMIQVGKLTARFVVFK